jgi:hypothetical protein
VPLNAPTKTRAVAHRGIIPQDCSKFCKYSKVLGIKLKSMRMAREELEVTDICFGNFEVEHLLSLLLIVIISLIISCLCICWKMRCVQFQLKSRDILVIKFVRHHFILFDLFRSSLEHLLGVRCYSSLIGPIADKE